MNEDKPIPRLPGVARFRTRLASLLLGMLVAICGGANALDIEQSPLYAGSRVPGNIVLVPSVEYPTIHSQANIGNYSAARRYSGYFDPDKCYDYRYSDTESERHFYPVGAADSFNCSDSSQWSGNYLNWTATQTIDPFRSALTGGYRVKDTRSETWLEKARHAPGYGLFPNRRMPGGGNDHALVRNVTAASWGSITTRIEGLGNRMWFTSDGGLGDDATVVAYNPRVHVLSDVQADWNRVYEVSVRVKVCDASVGVEANCRQYSHGWKPEGLIQEYSERIRYSIFGFLNESGNGRDGGVMRARQKFVGPRTHYPDLGPLANAAREWDPGTGVFVRNPDPDDATATGDGVADSGVINYLNKFGQMTTQAPKSNDPVSELYYAALRYFRGQGNLPEYTNNINYDLADGFPVITDWDDPIVYACQVNAALGIGDVYTHADHDIPNSPSEDLDLARLYTQTILDLEGINRNASNEFSGRGNSAYIAGLAYYANTNDLRPDDRSQPSSLGRQTLSTYWVDVRENQRLEPKSSNQYWLAAKYGGFQVPEGFDPLTTSGLDPSWWHRSGEYLVSGANGDVTDTPTTYLRPDNFYVASEADRMVESLRQAFQNIIDKMTGSSGGFASNSTVLEAGTKTYQARFQVESGSWSGNLIAYDVDPATGALTQAWSAADHFLDPDWDWQTRNVRLGGGAFDAGNNGGLNSGIVDYLRGDRSRETSSGGLRARSGILGSIVNSEPVHVGTPNGRLYLGATFDGADQYQTFAANNANRRGVVYVGANDGMLHGFDADNGREVYAFLPQAAIDAGLADYAQPEFEHRYFTDGDLTVADVYDGTSWRTILVGTMGRGGRGVFALDVTNPGNIQFLWEKSAGDVPALGNSLGKPVIAQVDNGVWRVFLGNGPNSTSGTATLIGFNVFNGNVTTTIDTQVGGDNGLSGVNIWASSSGGFFDTAYAGDLMGNLWKFNIGTGAASRIFRAGESKPITATPLVARRPGSTETWLFFGTGSYLSLADLSDKSVQTWYGLIDKGSEIPSDRSTLQGVEILAEGPLSETDLTPVRGIGSYSAVTGDGWYMDLLSPDVDARGERMVVPNRFHGNALIGTTRIPEEGDPCSPSGTGFIMAIDPFSGGRLGGGSYFDVDGDGNFDETIGQPPIPVSGVGTRAGPNAPMFLGDNIYVSLDDATSETFNLNPAGMAPRRVSWREIIGE